MVEPGDGVVRFGLFYECQLPRPWSDGDEQRLFEEALEQVELADSLGIDFVWEVEHHFLEEYSHSSAPEIFLAACSQRTKRIRLGHGIVQVLPKVNHPARVAERIATLDLISNGRVEFGTGEGTGAVEPGAFLVDYDTKNDQWVEALDVITRMFVEEPFLGYDGKFFQMPVRNVVPKPAQKPHPPMWVVCPRPETIANAAKNGLGALCFSMFIEPEDAYEWVDTYYSLLCSEECVPAGFAVNPELAVVQALMCHEDEATAVERGLDGSHFIGYTLQHYYRHGDTHRHGESRLWDDFLRERDDEGLERELGARPMERLAARPRARVTASRCAARSARRSSCGSTSDGMSRPVSTSCCLQPGGAQPARAHLRVARALRPRGHARVHRARRAAPQGEGRAAGTVHRAGARPEGASASRICRQGPATCPSRARARARPWRACDRRDWEAGRR